jgi:hypothetical protein
VGYWEPGMGDSFIFFGNREFLAAHRTDLTSAQQQKLAKADAQILAYAAKTYDDESDDDVQVLRQVASLIKREDGRLAA